MRDAPFSSEYAPQSMSSSSMIEVAESTSKIIDQPIYKIGGKYFIDTYDTLYNKKLKKESKKDSKLNIPVQQFCREVRNYFMDVVNKNEEEIKKIGNSYKK